MLKKVILVDDEYLFRQALKVKIPWEDIGFCICGEAKNGEEALELLEEVQPEVALVDINMPVMDGLGFVEEVRERGYPLEIIIITGYGEFNYAKQAIGLGVRNYLLKPVDELELRNELLKIKKRIENQEKATFKIDILKKQLQESIPLLRDKFLNDLVSGGSIVKSQSLWEKFEFLNIDLEGKLLRLLLVEIDTPDNPRWDEEERNLWSFAVSNMSKEIASESCKAEVFSDNNGRTCLILVFGEEDEHICDLIAINVSERIREAVERFLNFTVTIGLGGNRKDVGEIHASYKEAAFALKNKIVEGTNTVISFNDVAEPGLYFGRYTAEQRNQLLMSMRIGDENEIEGIVDRIFEAVNDNKRGYEHLFSTCLEMISAYFEFVTEAEISSSEIVTKPSVLIEELQQKKSIAEAKAWIKEIIKRAARIAFAGKKGRAVKLAAEIKKYLYENLSDINFRAESLAKKFYMNYSYLSHAFRKETGRTIVEFITEARVARAKELIDGGNYSVYDVSEKAGYIDSNYFSRCFKKHYGVTPTKYIENRKGEKS